MLAASGEGTFHCLTVIGEAIVIISKGCGEVENAAQVANVQRRQGDQQLSAVELRIYVVAAVTLKPGRHLARAPKRIRPVRRRTYTCSFGSKACVGLTLTQNSPSLSLKLCRIFGTCTTGC